MKETPRRGDTTVRARNEPVIMPSLNHAFKEWRLSFTTREASQECPTLLITIQLLDILGLSLIRKGIPTTKASLVLVTAQALPQ